MCKGHPKYTLQMTEGYSRDIRHHHSSVYRKILNWAMRDESLALDCTGSDDWASRDSYHSFRPHQK